MPEYIVVRVTDDICGSIGLEMVFNGHLSITSHQSISKRRTAALLLFRQPQVNQLVALAKISLQTVQFSISLLKNNVSCVTNQSRSKSGQEDLEAVKTTNTLYVGNL
jgi:hypothetical protein